MGVNLTNFEWSYPLLLIFLIKSVHWWDISSFSYHFIDFTRDCSFISMLRYQTYILINVFKSVRCSSELVNRFCCSRTISWRSLCSWCPQWLGLFRPLHLMSSWIHFLFWGLRMDRDLYFVASREVGVEFASGSGDNLS